MTNLIVLLYEIISGPLRKLKILLLISLGLFMSVLGLMFIFRMIPLVLFMAIGYLSSLIIVVIILQLRASAKLNDLHYELSLNYNMRVKNYNYHDFFLDGAAGNPSLLLLLFKSLQILKPRNILELGSGQTTKLLSSYFRENPGTYILSLEHDKHWANILGPYIFSNNKGIDYKVAPLGDKEFVCKGTNLRIKTKWYSGIDDFIGSKKFNLILIDGPIGKGHYARSGILQFIPAILDDTFIIILDDAERYGEINTINVLKKILDSTKIDYTCFDLNGIKRQFVFCSKHFEYIQYS